MEKNNYHPHFKKTLIVLTLVLIIITGYLLFVNLNIDKKETKINKTRKEGKDYNIPITSVKQPASQKAKGSLTLMTKNNQEIFKKDEIINLYVYAFSNYQPIVGYDLVLKFNPQIVSFEKFINPLNDFQVFIKQKEGQLMVTGLKDINSTTNTIFLNNPLITLVFKPKAQGKNTFSLEIKPNQKYESNLINNKSEDLLENSDELTIKVE